MSEITKPIIHHAFTHLNKRVTILGYSPVIGGLLLVGSLMLIIFSLVFKSVFLTFFSGIYLPAFILYTRKNLKSIKENRLEVSALFFFETKRKTYVDRENVINKILSKDD